MKKFRGLQIFIFILLIVLPPFAWAELRVFLPEAYEAFSEDLGENRNKASIKFGELLTSGDSLNDFYNDRVPFRSFIIKTLRQADAYIEAPYNESIAPKLMKLADREGEGTNNTQTSVATNPGSLDVLFNGETSASTTTVEPEPEPEPVPQPEPEPDPELGPQECVHEWVETERIDPACFEDGIRILTCANCGEELVENILATGHHSVLLKHQDADYMNYGYDEYVCGLCGETWKDNYVAKLIDTSYFAPVQIGDAIVGRYCWMFYAGGESLKYYKGTNIPKQDELDAYCKAFNDLKAACDKKGIKLLIAMFPNKEDVYPEYMPSYTVKTENKRPQVVADYVREKAGINILYPLDELRAMDMYWQTYKKYDTHWNQMGAFMTLQYMYNELGYEVTSPFSIQVENIDYRIGDLLGIAGIDYSTLPADVDYIIHYRDEIAVTSKTEGIVEDIPIYQSTCESAANDCHFVMLGDSFRTRMIPYVEKDFTSCTIAHRIYIDDIKEDIKDADVLVLSAVVRDESSLIDAAKKITKILNK